MESGERQLGFGFDADRPQDDTRALARDAPTLRQDRLADAGLPRTATATGLGSQHRRPWSVRRARVTTDDRSAASLAAGTTLERTPEAAGARGRSYWLIRFGADLQHLDADRPRSGTPPRWQHPRLTCGSSSCGQPAGPGMGRRTGSKASARAGLGTGAASTGGAAFLSSSSRLLGRHQQGCDQRAEAEQRRRHRERHGVAVHRGGGRRKLARVVRGQVGRRRRQRYRAQRRGPD